jgi:hypothetical protein
MTHQEALKEKAVERYLLGELSGAPLDSFEDHLFDCSECAMDVKAGATFIVAARTELSARQQAVAPKIKSESRWTSWFTRPWVLGPALVACLLLLGVQTFVVQPRLKQELAQVQTPAILNPLVLANAGARGDSTPEIATPEHAAFVISLDIPTTGGFSGYQCSLLAPDGSLLWQTTIPPEQARDALLLSVPADKTKEGLNSIVIKGLSLNGDSGGNLDTLATYRFRVRIQR